MDDESEIEEVIEPQRHDRWSALIVALGYGANCLKATSNFIAMTAVTVDGIVDMVVAHSGQLDYDKRFKEITDGNTSLGPGEVQRED